jgi:hypothetical protein
MAAVAAQDSARVGVIGLVVQLLGGLMLAVGAGAWVLGRRQLANEKIVVEADADWLAGDEVKGPLSAYAEAEVISKHALEASGGRTFAEMDAADPQRATVLQGSFLRASLFTSVLAFGVSALAMGLGVLNVLVGLALRRLAARPG